MLARQPVQCREPLVEPGQAGIVAFECTDVIAQQTGCLGALDRGRFDQIERFAEPVVELHERCQSGAGLVASAWLAPDSASSASRGLLAKAAECIGIGQPAVFALDVDDVQTADVELIEFLQLKLQKVEPLLAQLLPLLRSLETLANLLPGRVGIVDASPALPGGQSGRAADAGQLAASVSDGHVDRAG